MYFRAGDSDYDERSDQSVKIDEKASEVNAAALNQNDTLIPITVRFTVAAMSVIGEIAEANRMSKAELIRMAVDDRLIKYLEQVIFLEKEEAETVRKELYELGTVLGEIKYELHRIGVNINQQTKIKNMQYKHGITAGELDERNNLDFSDQMENIMRRFEAALKKAGDELCHILG